jgi:hypothetical protein
MPPTIELIYFDGCPNAEPARANLREALATLDLATDWQEWEQGDPNSPPHAREYGSPTILVNGRDVTGVGAGVDTLACRADGAPSIDTIRNALEGAL